MLQLQESINKLALITDPERKILNKTKQMPSIEALNRIVDLSRHIFFLGYFNNSKQSEQSRLYFIGAYMDELYDTLKTQVKLSFLSFKDNQPTNEEIDNLVLKFMNNLPEIKRILYTDVDAMFHSDPAVTSYSEIIFCYPVIQMMIHYRIAHSLHILGVPILPRIITEMAHSKTGIDIHPGAQIGEYFSIDHGTGVVIGETSIIGNHVTLYQGVTLGAKSFSRNENGDLLNIPRHPIIEDHVTIYSNSSILGRITIGHHTVIGGNIWLTNTVEPYSRILQQKAVSLSFIDGAGI